MKRVFVYTRWEIHEWEKIPCENTFTSGVCAVCREDKCEESMRAPAAV